MPYIKFNDLNMFYEEFGRGEALLFCTVISAGDCLRFRDKGKI